MYNQKKLIDGIRSFSPTRENWVSKPVEDLPEKVTVSFETGRSGVLDMKNPRAVVWAKLLDLQRKSNRPVYVEIDPETSVITQLLVPEPSRVMSITPQGEGDVHVVFFTSEARHYLGRENPDFQEMLDALQTAKDNETAILVTATRHDYEIIDVRPLPKALGAETPDPLSPPQPDPPVSPQRAQDLFDLMNSKSCDACNASCDLYPHCIPFKHAYDGCYARAHEMCRLMMEEDEQPEKVWIYGSLHVDTPNVHECGVNWGWHVAPTLMVTTPSGQPEKYVIDPSLCTTPVTVAAWKALQGDSSATLEYTTWEPFWSDRTTPDPDFLLTNHYLELKCLYLQDDCVLYGPPPYDCPTEAKMYLIQGNFGDRGNFEAVLREGSHLKHYWRNNDDGVHPWYEGPLFGDNVNSAPALIQGNFGDRGNFELVVREGNKLRHYWRNNDASGYPWHKGVLFGDSVNSAPALIQGNFGDRGNFELVVREGNKLRHYWRANDASGYPWHKGDIFSDHITFQQSLIQSNFGDRGNFELLTKRGNCFTHYWRDNQASGYPWHEIYFHAVPPIGTPPSPAKRQEFVGYFPNLRNFKITAPATGSYNCIAWSVGITDEWLWPGNTVAIFDAFYASHGWAVSSSGAREYKKRKVALWAMNSDPNDCQHGSRETVDCDWHESKCGGLERIVHDKRQMEGGVYGVIIKYYEKQDPNANLDLA